MSHHHHDTHHVHTVTESTLSFEEQLTTLLSHWITHNESHAGTYRDWAEKAAANHLDQAAEQLKKIADLTLLINEKLEEINIPGSGK